MDCFEPYYRFSGTRDTLIDISCFFSEWKSMYSVNDYFEQYPLACSNIAMSFPPFIVPMRGNVIRSSYSDCQNFSLASMKICLNPDDFNQSIFDVRPKYNKYLFKWIFWFPLSISLNRQSTPSMFSLFFSFSDTEIPSESGIFGIYWIYSWKSVYTQYWKKSLFYLEEATFRIFILLHGSKIPLGIMFFIINGRMSFWVSKSPFISVHMFWSLWLLIAH